MSWHKYYELEAIRRLRCDGRELLGEYIVITEKRDGENVSLTLEPSIDRSCFEFKVHSHNLEVASPDIVKRFMDTPEFDKASLFLNDETQYDSHYILYGELMKTVCPTRIEPNKKHCHWILFDIYDTVQNQYLSYSAIYQKAYHYKIPIVRQLDTFIPATMDDINNKVSEWLKWCKRHRREGIVGKAYRNQVFFKEKIDLPEKIKIVKPDRVQLPSMPEETILRALQHAYDVVGEKGWKDVKIAMPEVAKQIANEGREHLYTPPHNMFAIYKTTSIEQIRPKNIGVL
jgi:hypothetical protein